MSFRFQHGFFSVRGAAIPFRAVLFREGPPELLRPAPRPSGRGGQGFSPAWALSVLLVADGGLLGGLIGQAMIAAATHSPGLRPYVGSAAFSPADAPAFVIGASVGWLYASFSTEAAIWCVLARLAVLLHLPLLVLGVIDIAIFGYHALDFLFLPVPMAAAACPLLAYLWREAARFSRDPPPSPMGLTFSARTIGGILSLPLSLSLVFLALVPVAAMETAASLGHFVTLVTTGTWLTLGFVLVVVVPLSRLVSQDHPHVTVLAYLLTGALHIALAGLYVAIAYRLHVDYYYIEVAADIAPLFPPIAVILLATTPLAVLMVSAAMPDPSGR